MFRRLHQNESHPGAVAGLLGGLAVLAMLASGCGDPASDTGAETPSAASEDSDQAPLFILDDVAGQAFSLEQTAGRVVLIDFWATWCPPCRDEIPMLQKLDETYREQGLTIVAISDEDPEIVREFVTENQVGYPNLLDPACGSDSASDASSGVLTCEVADKYVVLGMPTGFLIDREGRIVERFVGPKPTKVLEQRIRELLDLPPAT